LSSGTKKRIPIIASLIIVFLPAFLTNNYVTTLANLIMCFSMLSMSVDLLTGYMGLNAFGNAGFFGFSAYAVAYFTVKMKMPHMYAIALTLVMLFV